MHSFSFLTLLLAALALGLAGSPQSVAQSVAQGLPPISIYFNKSVDTALAYPPGNVAIGDADLGAIAVQEIAKATYSVDMAMYNLNLQSVADALIAAKNRGVKVRAICHVENISGAKFQQLILAGIPLIANPTALSGQIQPLMHNKFLAIDARPGAIAQPRPVAIMGSWNATFGQTYEDPNNLVIFRDSAIADAYLKEFEEMWGSNEDTPNEATAKFGEAKADNTPHTFTVGGVGVTVFFSPSDRTASQINGALRTGENAIYTANLTFTYSQFASTLSRQKKSGADVRCIVDNVGDQGSQFSELQSFAEAFDWQLPGIFHHKYAVVDAIPLGTGTDPVVVTGSHNFTLSAELRNDENTVILHSPEIANQFLQEFAARYKEVGGTTPFVQTTSAERPTSQQRTMLRAYPNPFNGSIAIAADGVNRETVVQITDAMGNRVATLAVGPDHPVAYWNAAGLASGSYVARLHSSGEATMIYLSVAQ